MVNGDPGIAWGGTKGASLHLQAMARAWVQLGLRVTVLTSRVESSAQSLPHVDVVQVLPGTHWSGFPTQDTTLFQEAGTLALGESMANALRGVHSRRPVLAVYERYSIFGTAGLGFARKAGLPLLLEVNAPLIEEQLKYRTLGLLDVARAIETTLFREAGAVLAVSSPIADHVQSRGAAPGRVHVIGNGVDLARFHNQLDGRGVREKLQIRAGEFVYGFVGGLRQWHGLDLLVDAFEELYSTRPHTRLVIVGDGPRREWLKNRVANSPARHAITLAGAVESEAVPRWTAACDVLTAPYTTEAGNYFCPLKVAEALAVGRAVVASDLPATRDYLTPADCGLLTPVGNSAAFADAMKQLADNPALARAMGVRGALHARQSLGWDRIAERVLSLAGIESGRGVRA